MAEPDLGGFTPVGTAAPPTVDLGGFTPAKTPTPKDDDIWRTIAPAGYQPPPEKTTPGWTPTFDLRPPGFRVEENINLSDEGDQGFVRMTLGSTWRAFNEGFNIGAGPHPIGFPQKDVEFFIKHGLFRPDNRIDTVQSAFQAFNEAIMYPAMALLDAAIRAPMGFYRGLQAVGVDLGLHRDIVSIPDAFMGTPHPTGIPKTFPETVVRPASRLVEAPRGNITVEPTASRAGPERYVITDPLGAKVEGEKWDVRILRDREDGKPYAVYTDELGVTKVPEAWRDLHPEEIIAKVLGDHPMEGTPDISKVSLAPPEIPPPETTLPLRTPPELVEARSLGVIGPERPSLNEGKPAVAADNSVRTVAAEQKPGDVLRGPEPEPNAWRERFDGFVEKLKTEDDVKALIQDAARDNNEFVPARQGEIALSHVEDIARAAGVEPATVDRRGLGRLLKNDAEVRIAMELMLTSTEQVKSVAREVRTNASPENLIKLQEALLRRDLAVEQVVGLRAEWGRTGRTFQEFLRDVKDAETFNKFMRDQGRTPEGLRDIANRLDDLDRTQAGRFLNDRRNPGFWDKFMYYWINGLISGLVSQARNMVGNASFVLWESAAVKPVAGVIGKFHGGEKVYMGETLASTASLITAIPEAIKAFGVAFRENVRAPIPGAPTTAINPNIGMKPIGGVFGSIVGVPGRVATAFDSFFSILGYRAELNAQAWRMAAKEGLTAADDAFWNRKADIAMNPTPAMMDRAIAHAQYVSFVTELGDAGKALQNLSNKRFFGENGPQMLKFVLPFIQVPANIIKATAKQTPLAFLDRETRADLLGKNGNAARDTAFARIVAGSMLATYVAHQVNEDKITGYGPTDANERALWLRTHEPYSVRLGGWWFSYARFGPIADVIGMTANLTSIAPKLKDGEYSEAASNVVSATSRLVLDEVGLQGLQQMLQAMQEPNRFMERFLGSQASTLIPYSSMVRQTASIMDPHVRETKTVIDGFLNAVPFARQDLIAKRDWLGQPMVNPAYQSIIRQRPVNSDPIDLEVQRLHIKPGPPQDRIGGVKLTPKMYDEYQAIAGAFTKTTLDALLDSPGWYALPDYVRETAIRRVIETTRQAASGAFQASHPELIQMGIKQKVDHITGVTHTSRPKKAPAMGAPLQ